MLADMGRVVVGEPGTISEGPPFEMQADHRRSEGIAGPDGIDDVCVYGGFMQFFCNSNVISAENITASLSAGEKYSLVIGQAQTLIDLAEWKDA